MSPWVMGSSSQVLVCWRLLLGCEMCSMCVSSRQVTSWGPATGLGLS